MFSLRISWSAFLTRPRIFAKASSKLAAGTRTEILDWGTSAPDCTWVLKELELTTKPPICSAMLAMVSMAWLGDSTTISRLAFLMIKRCETGATSEVESVVPDPELSGAAAGAEVAAGDWLE